MEAAAQELPHLKLFERWLWLGFGKGAFAFLAFLLRFPLCYARPPRTQKLEQHGSIDKVFSEKFEKKVSFSFASKVVLLSRNTWSNFFSGWSSIFRKKRASLALRCRNQGVPLSVRRYVRPADLQVTGPVLLRPWHLVYSPNCGAKGLIEPDPWLPIYGLISKTHMPRTSCSNSPSWCC